MQRMFATIIAFLKLKDMKNLDQKAKLCIVKTDSLKTLLNAVKIQ